MEDTEEKTVVVLEVDTQKSSPDVPKGLRAFIAGSTGEVGKALTHELARSPQFTKVTLITRRPIELPPDKIYTKFDQKIVDFDNLAANHAADFKGYDIGFCSLGTSRAKSGVDGFVKVDHDYIMAVGQLAKQGGCKHFSLVSSAGANKNSKVLYYKVKGQVEEEMKQLGFPRLSIWRPKVLLVKRVESRPGEKFFRCCFGCCDCCRCLSTHVSVLVKAMANNAFKPGTSGIEIMNNRIIYNEARSI